jgi:hypothetical protein
MASHFRAMCRMAPAAVLVLSLGSVAATPALAADDGQESFVSAVLAMFGIDKGTNKDAGPAIDYRERAPLVLPPKMELRQPVPSVAARTRVWPQDPELVKARKAAEQRAKAPRVSDSDHDTAISAEESRRRGTLDPNAKAPTSNCLEEHTCDPTTFWSMLKNTKKQDTEKFVLVPGREPPREYLTQPPPGYLSPTRVVKATAETPKMSGDDSNNNSANYFRHLKESQSSPDVR